MTSKTTRKDEDPEVVYPSRFIVHIRFARNEAATDISEVGLNQLQRIILLSFPFGALERGCIDGDGVFVVL